MQEAPNTLTLNLSNGMQAQSRPRGSRSRSTAPSFPRYTSSDAESATAGSYPRSPSAEGSSPCPPASEGEYNSEDSWTEPSLGYSSLGSLPAHYTPSPFQFAANDIQASYGPPSFSPHPSSFPYTPSQPPSDGRYVVTPLQHPGSSGFSPQQHNVFSARDFHSQEHLAVVGQTTYPPYHGYHFLETPGYPSDSTYQTPFTHSTSSPSHLPSNCYPNYNGAYH